MRAFSVPAFGEAGSVQEVARPVPGEGEVLVRIEAASVNAIDPVILMGALQGMMEHRFPFIPGMDGAGVVEAVGPGVDGFAAGDEVFGMAAKAYLGGGTFAEYATMSAVGLARRPASLTMVEAATLPLAGVTALAAIAAVRPLDGTVLVVGATGGVGSVVTHLAAREGARVLAVTRGENGAYARELGAAEVLDYTTGDLLGLIRAAAPDGLDAIIDMASDASGLARLAELVRRGGRVASTARAADVDALAAKGIRGANVDGAPQLLASLVSLVSEGRLRPPAIRTFPLQRAGEALAEQAARHVKGKQVLVIG